MLTSFADISGSPFDFFNILPQDWREGIVPYWSEYKLNTRVFVLKREETVMAGGLVFCSPSPDTLAYGSMAEEWFAKGYLYLGFIWVAENLRGNQLGSHWLTKVQAHYKGQKFWLAIEEEKLQHFYRQNGFQMVAETTAAGYPEWIMVNQLPS